MKVTDYGPRIAHFDSFLNRPDMIGVEVGCDVGAHAEALLTYCPIKHLFLIDIWDREYYMGICVGRLYRWRSKITIFQGKSSEAKKGFTLNSLDFAYIDIIQDYDITKEALNNWFGIVKPGGFLCCRNYAASNPGLSKAVDEFISENDLKFELLTGEIIIFK